MLDEPLDEPTGVCKRCLLNLDVIGEHSTKKWAKGQKDAPFYRSEIPDSDWVWSKPAKWSVTRASANNGPGGHHLHGSQLQLMIGW